MTCICHPDEASHWRDVATALSRAIERHRDWALRTGSQHHDEDEELWSVMDRHDGMAN